MRNLFFTSRSTNDHLRTNEIQQRREIRIISTEPAPTPAPAPAPVPVPVLSRSTASRSTPSLFSVSAMFGVRQGSCKSCG